MYRSWYEQQSISQWRKLIDGFEKHSGSGHWIFRGHESTEWALETVLERQYLLATIDPSRTNRKRPAEKKQIYRAALAQPDPQTKDGREIAISRIEGGLLREFQRRSHHYQEEAIPESADTLEWLALMRHYGAPTRLLDWTYSFFVAVFFALADCTGDSAIWAVDTAAMPGPCKEIIARDPKALIAWQADESVTKPDTFDALFLRPQPPLNMVGAVTPRRLNRRLTTQQGTFLCPGNITVPFEDNLQALVDQPGSQFKPIKYVLRFSFEERQQALRRLLRMNVSWATLFPDMGGLAKSLQTRVVYHEHLAPDPEWHVVCG
jgi:hypothetical protein